MTKFEVLTLLVALLAIVPGLIALVRQSGQRRRIEEVEEAQLRQNRATAALHEKQHQLLLAAEKSKGAAHVKLDLIKDGNNYRFLVTNIGTAAAKQVEVKILTEDPEDDPTVDTDYKDKFPAPVLEPGSSLQYFAAIYLNSPSSYNAVVSWTNPDGTRVENAAYVAL